MKLLAFSSLADEDKALLRDVVSTLDRSINKVTHPNTCAVAIGSKGRYRGNNIFLSNDTMSCAEAGALASAAAAGDHKVTKLYLAIGRSNGKPEPVSPCGNCRQWLHDFARLNSNVIEVFSTTSNLDNVLVTDSDELLPGGFKSAGLGRMIEEK
jgi:cytidine deaminase